MFRTIRPSWHGLPARPLPCCARRPARALPTASLRRLECPSFVDPFPTSRQRSPASTSTYAPANPPTLFLRPRAPFRFSRITHGLTGKQQLATANHQRTAPATDNGHLTSDQSSIDGPARRGSNDG